MAFAQTASQDYLSGIPIGIDIVVAVCLVVVGIVVMIIRRIRNGMWRD